MFKMGVLCNMAGRNAQSLACSCSPGPLWVKAEGIEEVFNSHRSNERTFVQSNPITFPGIKAPEGLFHSPCGPKNVARKVTAIHCVSKGISELVSLLILLPRDGESIPTLVGTPIYLNVREKPPDSVSQPSSSQKTLLLTLSTSTTAAPGNDHCRILYTTSVLSASSIAPLEALKQADHALDRITPLDGTTSQTASQLPSAPRYVVRINHDIHFLWEVQYLAYITKFFLCYKIFF